MKFLILLISLALAFASQEIPIPSRLDGVKIGRSNSTFHLEAHLDLLCPGSKDSFFNIVKVIQDYNLFDTNFLFTVHIFPLPYHTFSFKLSIIEKFVEDIYGETLAFNYIKFVFDNQDSYSNSNLSNLTITQIEELIAENVSSYFKGTIEKTEILAAFQNSSYDGEARISWKFGCHRSVAGTPTHFVNGVRLNDSWEMEYEDWVKFLQNYVPLNRTMTISLRNPK